MLVILDEEGNLNVSYVLFVIYNGKYVVLILEIVCYVCNL